MKPTKAQIDRYKKLREVEPGLLRLEERIRRDPAKGKSRAYQEWYDLYKPRLEKLVGFRAKNKAVKDMESYDAAYRVLHYLLASRKPGDWL